MNKKNSRSNKKAIIVLLAFTTFFTIGSLCGIFSAFKSCSNVEVHADTVVPDGSSTFYESTFSLSPFTILEVALTGSSDTYSLGNVSFIAPIVLRYGYKSTDTSVFQVGTFLPDNYTLGVQSSDSGLMTGKYYYFDISPVGGNLIPFYVNAGSISSNGTLYTSHSFILLLDFTVTEPAPVLNTPINAFKFSQLVDFGAEYNYSLELWASSSFVTTPVSILPYFSNLPPNGLMKSVSLTYYLIPQNVDISSLLNENYNKGDSDGFYRGYIEGKRIGDAEGFARGTAFAERPTFKQLFDAVAYVPVKTVTSLFNFELLGTNMLDFVTALATIVAMIGVLRFII